MIIIKYYRDSSLFTDCAPCPSRVRVCVKTLSPQTKDESEPVGVRFLCEVSGDCWSVLRTLLDREVRARLITILRERGKAQMLYTVFVVHGLGFPDKPRVKQEMQHERRRLGQTQLQRIFFLKF